MQLTDKTLTRLRYFRQVSYFLLLATGFLFQVPTVSAQAPAWWTTYSVLSSGATASDYTVANQGQVKYIASKARAYLNATLPGGAGNAVNNMVDGFGVPGSQTNDYVVINNGQLKTLAKLFYDRLINVGYTTTYPWITSGLTANDYVAANIGQIKNLFSFDLSTFTPVPPYSGVDSDSDGLPDAWEYFYFSNLNQSGTGDFDNDGMTNLAEFQSHGNPAGTLLTLTLTAPPGLTLLP